jgi:hypothetical protein
VRCGGSAGWDNTPAGINAAPALEAYHTWTRQSAAPPQTSSAPPRCQLRPRCHRPAALLQAAAGGWRGGGAPAAAAAAALRMGDCVICVVPRTRMVFFVGWRSNVAWPAAEWRMAPRGCRAVYCLLLVLQTSRVERSAEWATDGLVAHWIQTGRQHAACDMRRRCSCRPAAIPLLLDWQNSWITGTL